MQMYGTRKVKTECPVIAEGRMIGPSIGQADEVRGMNEAGGHPSRHELCAPDKTVFMGAI